MPRSRRASSPSAREAYFAGDERERAVGLLQILRPDGTCDEDSLPDEIDKPRALEMYRGMLLVRVMDERLMALQRQGRIGFYGEARGQEATVVGSAAALEDGDWIVPALREAGVGIFRGLPLRQYVAQIFGNDHDHSRGRQMPCHPCDRGVNYVVMSSCVASQVPHAIGIGMAMKIARDDQKVVVGYMGDGATSEGDFHTSMNFAGVFTPPVVLICQNNQWAISTPGSRQSSSETLAIKALAYGVEPVRCDGNDVFAVFAAARWACERARTGKGPTFIEALTYRVGAHSSSDDPSRYRDEEVTREWKSTRDPLERARTWLRARDWLAEDDDARLHEELEAEVRAAIAEEEAVRLPPIESVIEDVFEEVPWHLRDELERHRRGG